MGKFHRWGMIFAFLVIVGCAYMGIRMVFVEDKDSEVPSVTGMQIVDAVDALQEKGLLAKVDKVDSAMPADTVVSQNLQAGEKVSRGKVVLLRVSKGGAIQPIPDVRGMKFEEGVKKLSEAGFKVNKVKRVADALKQAGTIIAQNPSAPQQVSSSCMVSLLVSSGANGENQFVAIPELRGSDRASAVEMLEQLGLRLGQTAEAPSSSIPEGSVLASRPKSGTKVPAGSAVNLTFARKPLESELADDTPPQQDHDKERAAAVRRVVVKETAPTTIPSKIPEVKVQKPQVKTEKKEDQPKQQPQAAAPKEANKEPAVKEAPKQETPRETAPANVPPAQGSKTAKVRYQVPPLTKPLSLKIEMADEMGTRVLKDGVAKSGEYISMNVPYSGEARITIFLGGDFVWQDRYN
ncbi:MAG: PASTA domain-containing protein [Synergistes sp.]|nr:PASTA domain-containing protein [Synergistes sp.]